MADIQNDSGVSVIVGTLLLILITVTAAAGLALMVSQMQKDEMNRQSHLAAVKSEKIEILNIGLKNDRGAWNQSPFNITENQSWNNWSSITLTLSNLNTEDVKIIGIAINDRYTRNYSTVTDTPVEVRVPYNFSYQQYLTLPGTKSQKIRINFTDDFPFTQYIPTENQIHVRIMTSIYNTFEKTFKPPNPVFETRIETENLGVTERDVIMFDGSRSTADNTVVRWDWTIQDRNNETMVVENITSGKIVRWNPFSPGPFRVWLTVTDDVGMTRTSSPVDIPANLHFTPPWNLKAEFDTPMIMVSVKDINNNPLSNITVSFLKSNDKYGNLTLERYYSTTDLNGTAFVNVTEGRGTVKVVYAKLPQTEINVGVIP
jgi:flagellin-like protein